RISQFDAGSDTIFEGVIDGQSAYLTFRFALDEGFPPELKQIKERFPPLRTRICDWPSPRILAEVGKARSGGLRGEWARDEVLVDELITRQDLASADFIRLLRMNAGTTSLLGDNLPYVIQAAVK